MRHRSLDRHVGFNVNDGLLLRNAGVYSQIANFETGAFSVSCNVKLTRLDDIQIFSMFQHSFLVYVSDFHIFVECTDQQKFQMKSAFLPKIGEEFHLVIMIDETSAEIFIDGARDNSLITEGGLRNPSIIETPSEFVNLDKTNMGSDITIMNTAKGKSWHHTAHRRTFKVRGDGPPGTPPKRWTRQTSTSSSTILVRMPIHIPKAYVA